MGVLTRMIMAMELVKRFNRENYSITKIERVSVFFEGREIGWVEAVGSYEPTFRFGAWECENGNK